MISANKAFELIIENPGNWGNEEIDFQFSVGRILSCFLLQDSKTNEIIKKLTNFIS